MRKNYTQVVFCSKNPSRQLLCTSVEAVAPSTERSSLVAAVKNLCCGNTARGGTGPVWVSHASQPINNVGVTAGHASPDTVGFPSGRLQLQLVSCQSRPKRTCGLGVRTNQNRGTFASIFEGATGLSIALKVTVRGTWVHCL